MYTMDLYGRILHIKSDIEEMDHPMRCTRCGLTHDAAKVTVVQRYSDCSVWKCPGCKALIDDRPGGYGGAVRPEGI